jgi:uncharacterized protein YabE (DUF348 family)
VSLPKPRTRADTNSEINSDNNRPSPSIAHRPTDRLHIGIAVAIAFVALIAIAFPLTVPAESGEAPKAPVRVVSEGLTSTIQNQARVVASALATTAAAPTPEGAAVAQTLEKAPAGELVPQPVIDTAADLLVRGALAQPEARPAPAMEIGEPVRFTLHENGFPIEVYSTRSSVSGALVALDSGFSPHDVVYPSPGTQLTAGLHVFVARADPVLLSVAGAKALRIFTHAETVGELLNEQGITLDDLDSVEPAPDTLVTAEMSVVVTAAEEITVTEETVLPFETIYLDDPTLTEGESYVSQYGADGYVLSEYKVSYENGEEIGRELISETVVEPTYQVIVQGTAPPTPEPVAVAAAVQAPSGDIACAQTMSVWATWYNAASAGGSTTATGTTVKKGTVAVDPSVIPLGTQMYIPGYGYGWAEDTGGAVKGKIIDLGYGPNDVVNWSSGYVDICILN